MSDMALAGRLAADERKRYARAVLPVLTAVIGGYTYDPGSSDLDDEQPITVRMNLGDYRRACRISRELEKLA